MLVIPAIDLRDGHCVRLLQGDFERQTTYGDDPVKVARHWLALGAPWLHVVDLDGAREGRPAQLELVSRIARLGGNVELGGGLRTLDDVRSALDVGVRRVIIGTAAVEDESLLRDAIREFGRETVVLGVDARNGRVATHAWTETSDNLVADVIRSARNAGVIRVIYTDIDRDGMLASPNFSAMAEVASLGVKVVASGGVSSVDDLRGLAAIPGVEAAIVGKALYERSVQIADANDWWISPGRPG